MSDGQSGNEMTGKVELDWVPQVWGEQCGVLTSEAPPHVESGPCHRMENVEFMGAWHSCCGSVG